MPTSCLSFRLWLWGISSRSSWSWLPCPLAPVNESPGPRERKTDGRILGAPEGRSTAGECRDSYVSTLCAFIWSSEKPVNRKFFGDSLFSYGRDSQVRRRTESHQP